jgi:hypothetical protein
MVIGVGAQRAHMKEYNSGCMSFSRLDNIEFHYGFANDPIRRRLGEIHRRPYYGSFNRVD